MFFPSSYPRAFRPSRRRSMEPGTWSSPTWKSPIGLIFFCSCASVEKLTAKSIAPRARQTTFLFMEFLPDLKSKILVRFCWKTKRQEQSTQSKIDRDFFLHVVSYVSVHSSLDTHH